MIEQPNVDQAERLLHSLRDEFVGLTRLGNPGGMVVSDDHRRRIALQGELDYFAGMYARTVDGAAKQLFVLDQAVALIEIQATEHFMLEIAQLRG